MDYNLEVALAKEICFGCTKEIDGPILMNKILTKKHAKKVKKLHGKVIGFSDKLCETCENYTKQGILCIGIKEKLSEDMNNPYRSGHIAVVKKEAMERIFNNFNAPKNIVLLEYEAGLKVGIWNE